MLQTIVVVSVICAMIPCALFLWNILLYRRLPLRRTSSEPALIKPDEALRISVLIPARNEEFNIDRALTAILANDFPHYEVIVMDDHSTDATREIVERYKSMDPRVRSVQAPRLPEGWCGKQHACYQLAQQASGEILLFIDADVRLSSDAIGRIVQFMDSNKAALASGVPRQIFRSTADRLLIPLIHFVLLGYLPLWAMRRTKMAAMSGGCGQLFVAQKRAYDACGGHSKIPATLHDGLKLPRVFRNAGLPTELFDATDIASCQMYPTNAETIAGLGKNAHEGLGARETILPMTFLLLMGQVFPLIGLLLALSLEWSYNELLAIATIASYIPRIIASRRFHQPILSAIFHPLAVLALLVIQWQAFIRHMRGRPPVWKGRAVGAELAGH